MEKMDVPCLAPFFNFGGHCKKPSVTHVVFFVARGGRHLAGVMVRKVKQWRRPLELGDFTERKEDFMGFFG